MADTVKPVKARLEILAHIAFHDGGGRWPVRVPDHLIKEADQSIEDGQTYWDNGRWLTEAGRAALKMYDEPASPSTDEGER